MPGVKLLSLLVPLADVPVNDRASILRTTIRKMLEEVGKNNDLKNADLALRALEANDLGLAGHAWQETVSATVGTANTYENSAINSITLNDRICAIYGVYVASSWDSVSGLRIEVGARRTHQWDLQGIITEQPRRASREERTLICYQGENGDVDPVIIPAITSILIQHYVRGATAVGIQPAELIFRGLVLERTGGGGAGLQVQ